MAPSQAAVARLLYPWRVKNIPPPLLYTLYDVLASIEDAHLKTHT